MKNNNKETKKLLILDGNAIIHRSFHALPPFTTKKGELVNAVYGFSSTLIAVRDKFKPDYIAVSFDLKGPTFRHDQFKDYKATRVKAPDELYHQIDRVKEVVRAFGIPIYEKEGFEADDVIGSIARNIEHETRNIDIETVIVTGDLDTLQLIDDKTKVYTMSRGLSKAVLYDKKAVYDRYELTPEQLKDFKGLRGDASDNIPGVKGIGEKGAINLLKEYGTLESVYKNIENIKGVVRDKLEKDKAQAFLSKSLGTIKTDVDIDFDLEKCKTHDFDEQEVRKLFQELNFYSLIKRAFNEKELPKEEGYLKKKKVLNGVKDFKYETIKDKDVDSFIEEVKKQKEIALASEDGGIAFSWKTGRVNFFELKSDNVEKIRNILEDDGIAKVGWNMKRDYKFFKQKGIKLGGLYFDVLLGYYLLHSGEKIDIESVVFEELEEEFQEEEKGQISLDSFSSKKKGEKLCQKVDYIWKLKEIVSEKIEKISEKQNKARVNSLSSLFYEVEMPLVEILAEIEENGVRVNEIILKGVNEKIEKRIENLEREIQDMAGEELNINSPNQLQKILFEKMNIPTEGIKKTKTGYSTAASELNKIRGEHKIIKKIEEYREIFKLKTTYLDNLYELAKKGKRIHSTFNQAVTSTGRLSSENPNLQNIPIRTELGKVIRTAFEAKEGNLLISADYSQIDLRVMAHMSGDKKMTEAFWEGADIHTKTAAQVNDVTHSKVTQKMRSQAKALNFGVIYGMGSFGFSQSAKIEVKEAKEFISAYMKEFSGVADFIRKTKEEAKEKGYVETELGRRRYLPEINSPNFQVQAGAERMAVNMPIQGLAADIMKLAMIKVYEKYKKNNFVKMILQVHDEIILEVREKDAEKISKEMKEIMENVYKLKVPLVVDTKTGLNWGEL